MNICVILKFFFDISSKGVIFMENYIVWYESKIFLMVIIFIFYFYYLVFYGFS